MPARDWDAEIDRWTERFRDGDDPPEPFATALREGWTPEARAAPRPRGRGLRLRHEAWLEQIGAAGVDLVRLDCKAGSCGVCANYCG